MTFLQSLILGIVQGLTEFLPISSSAHLVLVPYLFEWNLPESQVFPFGVLVQMGTLLAVILYFRKDLWNIIKGFVLALVHKKPFESADARLGWYLILATIPAGLAGLLLKDRVEAAFNNARITAIFLFVTALFLFAAEFFSRRNRTLEQMTWKDALWIGIFQAFSIFPGISRSGSTITGGMTRHFERRSAARFSFLMSIPVMLAAGLLSVPDLLAVPDVGNFLPILLVGFLAAGIVGYLSIRWLLSFLNRHSLIYFAIYCVLLGSTVLIFSHLRPVNSANAIAGQATSTQAAQGTEILQLTTTSGTEWLLPIAHQCATDDPTLTLILTSDNSSSSPSDGEAVFLRWGEPAALQGFASQLGEVELAFVASPGSPFTRLPMDTLQEITRGKFTTWRELYKSCQTCFKKKPEPDVLNAPFDLYAYSAGEDIQSVFAEFISASSPQPPSFAFLVPSTQALNEILLSTPGAFGYLPAPAADSTLRRVKVTEKDEVISFSRPLIAITETEPQGAVRQWLSCVQNAIHP